MRTKEQLIVYLESKYEALDFWMTLREAVPSEKKIAALESEIAEAKQELRAHRLAEKTMERLAHRSMTDDTVRRMNKVWEG